MRTPSALPSFAIGLVALLALLALPISVHAQQCKARTISVVRAWDAPRSTLWLRVRKGRTGTKGTDRVITPYTPWKVTLQPDQWIDQSFMVQVQGHVTRNCRVFGTNYCSNPNIVFETPIPAKKCRQGWVKQQIGGIVWECNDHSESASLPKC